MVGALPEDVDDIVVTAFHSLGLSSKNGTGISQLTWGEVDAYSRMSGVDLTSWEAEQIVLMSRYYCLWKHKGCDPACSSPWNSELNNSDNAIVNSKFKALAKLAKSRSHK